MFWQVLGYYTKWEENDRALVTCKNINYATVIKILQRWYQIENITDKNAEHVSDWQVKVGFLGYLDTTHELVECNTTIFFTKLVNRLCYSHINMQIIRS